MLVAQRQYRSGSKVRPRPAIRGCDKYVGRSSRLAAGCDTSRNRRWRSGSRCIARTLAARARSVAPARKLLVALWKYVQSGRRDRGGRDQERCITSSFFHRKLNLPQARSASADPGGRTDGSHGFKRRNEEWPRPLEPSRRKRHFLCICLCATTECEFYLARKTHIAEVARNLDRKCEDRRCPDRTANTRSPCRARWSKHDDVLAQRKAKPLRGGLNGPAFTLSARAILYSTRSGRRGGRRRKLAIHNARSCRSHGLLRFGAMTMAIMEGSPCKIC